MTRLGLVTADGRHVGRLGRGHALCDCGWDGGPVETTSEAERRFAAHLAVLIGGTDPWPWREGTSRMSHPRHRAGFADCIYDPRPLGSWTPSGEKVRPDDAPVPAPEPGARRLTPSEVECSTCGAGIGRPCVAVESRRLASVTHVARKQAAMGRWTSA